MSRLAKTTHHSMWLVWGILFAAFVLKYALLASGEISLSGRNALIFSLIEDGCWIFLQPLSSVVWIQRHWKQISPGRRFASWIFFIIPALVSFMIYSNMFGELIKGLSSETDSYLAAAAGLEEVLEIFWIYFPLASLLSWYFQKRRIACRAQLWNCRYLFAPAVLALTVVGLLHLVVFRDEGSARTLLGIIEECLWVYIPLVGNVCGSLDHRRRMAKLSATA